LNRYRISWIVTIHRESSDQLERISNSLSKSISKDDELIVVGDATDKKNFTFFQNITTNHKFFNFNSSNGPSRSRNVAIENSEGAWLIMLDADDYFFCNPKLLSHECEMAEINESSIIVTEAYFLNGIKLYNPLKQGLVTFEEQTQLFNKYTKKLEGNSPLNHVWGKLFLRTFILDHKINFNEKMRAFEDTLFCLQAFHSSKSIYKTKALTYIYCNNDKKDATRTVRNMKDFKLLCKKIVENNYSNENYHALLAIYFAKTLFRQRSQSLLSFSLAIYKLFIDRDLKNVANNLHLVDNDEVKAVLLNFNLFKIYTFWARDRRMRKLSKH
jgi:glycosyltransferase involved in cell wall biosynthesis